jgi:hypothetical protein
MPILVPFRVDFAHQRDGSTPETPSFRMSAEIHARWFFHSHDNLHFASYLVMVLAMWVASLS